MSLVLLMLGMAAVSSGCQWLVWLIPTATISLRYERCDDPRATDSLNQAGRLMRLGGYRDALPLLREALSHCPNHVPTHMLYQDTAKRVGGDAERAMRNYYLQLEDNVRSPLVPFLRARLARHEVECRDYLRTALRRDRRFVWAHLEMARMRRGVNQPEVALAEIEKALAMRPGFVPAQKEIAELYLELDRPELAEPYYESYLRARPDDERAQRAYAWLMIHKRGKPQDAQVVVESLLEKHPEDVDLLMELAAIHWRQNRLAEAIEMYQKVLRREPQNATAVLNLGDLYFDWQSKTGPDAKDAAWREARKCYRYFLGLRDDTRALLLLNRLLAVPYRLEQINRRLGPAAEGPVRLEDLLEARAR